MGGEGWNKVELNSIFGNDDNADKKCSASDIRKRCAHADFPLKSSLSNCQGTWSHPRRKCIQIYL